MNTPIIENLLPRLRETVATQMKNYLGGEGELSGIFDSLEFWWDGIRSREFPELPMWDELPTPDQDCLFDEWIAATEGFFASRGKPGGPSNASGAGAPSVHSDVQPVWVEMTGDRWCPECGKSGPHWHTNPISSPSDASCASPTPLVPEVVKEALETVASWKLPPSGHFWEKGGEEMSYGAAFGSNGERDFMKGVAESALTALRSYIPAPSPSVELLKEAKASLEGIPAMLRWAADPSFKANGNTRHRWRSAAEKAESTLSKLKAALA